MGPDRVKEAIRCIQGRDFRGCAELMLSFYDKLYDRNIVCATGEGRTDKAGRECPIVKVATERCCLRASPWHALFSNAIRCSDLTASAGERVELNVFQ